MTDEVTVRCGACNSEWTHLDDVVVATRRAEDGDVVNVRLSAGGDINVNAAEYAVPSPGRRSAFALLLTCENCPEVTEIRYTQHKGQTFLTTEVQSA